MTTLDGSPYQGYLYAYPHKTAYRPLRPRPSLREVWAAQRRDALFLYLHLPFCQMRCGYCNLFTRANPPSGQVGAYVDQLGRQAERVRDALGDGTTVAQVAIGGGTPTYLTTTELVRLFDVVEAFGVRPGTVPLAVETSPGTATDDRMRLLAERGTTRVSMGVQSFLDAEVRSAGRMQRRSEVERALTTIRSYSFPILNLDLIYGIDGQSPRSWAQSLAAVLQWRPEEIFLYPLYVRPLTGLARRRPNGSDTNAGLDADSEWDDRRLRLYRQGRDTLRAAGYRQLSLRHFRRADVPTDDGVDYSCQDDGMVGLGCGARSYTTDLHYSFDYAVGIGQVRAIIDDYLSRPAADFDVAEVGFRLDAVEQRRRWLVKSLLRAEGFDTRAYRSRFGSSVTDDFPEQLAALAQRDWLNVTPDWLVLTEAGLERSDAIGPWLVSGPVRSAMEQYVLH